MNHIRKPFLIISATLAATYVALGLWIRWNNGWNPNSRTPQRRT